MNQKGELVKFQSPKLGGDSEPDQTEQVPATAWKAEAGTDLPSGRASEASSVPTYTNAAVSSMMVIFRD